MINKRSADELREKRIKAVVGKGNSAEEIVKTAEELHIDIIVMGSHSRRWLENILMGSVAEKVLHHSTILLFIIAC